MYWHQRACRADGVSILLAVCAHTCDMAWAGMGQAYAYLLMIEVTRRHGEVWKQLKMVQEQLSEVLVKICACQSAVPIFHNVPTIHDLPKNVSQVIPRNLHSMQL